MCCTMQKIVSCCIQPIFNKHLTNHSKPVDQPFSGAAFNTGFVDAKDIGGRELEEAVRSFDLSNPHYPMNIKNFLVCAEWTRRLRAAIKKGTWRCAEVAENCYKVFADLTLLSLFASSNSDSDSAVNVVTADSGDKESKSSSSSSSSKSTSTSARAFYR